MNNAEIMLQSLRTSDLTATQRAISQIFANCSRTLAGELASPAEIVLAAPSGLNTSVVCIVDVKEHEAAVRAQQALGERKLGFGWIRPDAADSDVLVGGIGHEGLLTFMIDEDDRERLILRIGAFDWPNRIGKH